MDLKRHGPFRIWRYRSDRDRMLVRAPGPRNTDLLFAGVEYLEMDTMFVNLEVAEPTEVDLARVRAVYKQDVRPDFVRVLAANGCPRGRWWRHAVRRRYVVVAAHMGIEENEKKWYENSLGPGYNDPRVIRDFERTVPAAELLRSRNFQIWAINVSHSWTLIRSSRSKDHPRNLDVSFESVEYLSLPSKLEGLEIAEPTAADLDRVRAAHNVDVKPAWVRVLVSKGRRHIVVAPIMMVEENDLEPFDSGSDRILDPRDS